ncbi:MAG: amino acid racemase [Pontixanthobacter sp.]
MRKLGIIGGMSWVTTHAYYERINTLVQRRTTPLSSAPLLIESLDFSQLHGLDSSEDWEAAKTVLSEAAKRLEQGGAGALIIAANSMHKIYDDIAGAVSIPILHIADCVGARMKEEGATNAALIGTRNVMTENFYRRRLVSHGVDLLAPDMKNVEMLHSIIYDQLMLGKRTRDAERQLKTLITRKAQDGAEAIVLACTELELVVDVSANVLPIFDSSRIHCDAAADWILGDD